MVKEQIDDYDEIIIGAGIIGITYAFLLKTIKPEISLLILEKFDQVATESSNPWNNAGTWHGANCELNYTPVKNGQVDITKALSTHTRALQTLELLTYLKNQHIITDSKKVINRTSHMSMVIGQSDREFLHKRHKVMTKHHFFKDMQISDNPKQIATWAASLLTQGRSEKDIITATTVTNGADINYGALTQVLYQALTEFSGVKFSFLTTPHKIEKTDRYRIYLNNGQSVTTDRLLIAAGGGTLPLLQKMHSPKAKSYGAFPVGGRFLVCEKPEITSQLQAKVYGKAAVGSPPMSVPHFDSRVVDGTKYILFGPQATFNPRFLKKGTVWDLLKSIRLSNLLPLLNVFWHETLLVRYLIRETLSGKNQLFAQLKTFYPEAKAQDWRLHTAGQRVQIIKRRNHYQGELKLGTETVIDNQGTLGALLGASPGASVACSIALEFIEQLHTKKYDQTWETALREIIPSYQQPISKNPHLYRQIRAAIDQALNL